MKKWLFISTLIFLCNMSGVGAAQGQLDSVNNTAQEVALPQAEMNVQEGTLATEKSQIEKYFEQIRKIHQRFYQKQKDTAELLSETEDVSAKEKIYLEFLLVSDELKKEVEDIITPDRCLKYNELILQTFQMWRDHGSLSLDLVKLQGPDREEEVARIQAEINELEKKIQENNGLGRQERVTLFDEFGIISP